MNFKSSRNENFILILAPLGNNAKSSYDSAYLTHKNTKTEKWSTQIWKTDVIYYLM
jgi:hypothetical protein